MTRPTQGCEWVDDKPNTMCSFEKFLQKPCRGPILPYMRPERNKTKKTANSELRGEPSCYLNSGNDNTSDCTMLMSPPAGRSY